MSFCEKTQLTQSGIPVDLRKVKFKGDSTLLDSCQVVWLTSHKVHCERPEFAIDLRSFVKYSSDML